MVELMRFKTLAVIFLLFMCAVVHVGSLSVNASSSLIQQNGIMRLGDGGNIPPGQWLSLSFPSSVMSGNVIVVAVAVENGYTSTPPTVTSVVDSRGSSFIQAVDSSITYLHVYIYYALLSSSGPDTVNVTFNVDLDDYSGFAYLFIYEVSGVNTTDVMTANGSGYIPITPGPVSTAASASFEDGAFLLAIGACDSISAYWIAGSGFQFSPVQGYDEYFQLAKAMYSTSGVSSPTFFNATLGLQGSPDDENWVEAGIALNPLTEVPSSVGGEVFVPDKLVMLLPYLALVSIVAASVIATRKLARMRG